MYLFCMGGGGCEGDRLHDYGVGKKLQGSAHYLAISAGGNTIVIERGTMHISSIAYRIARNFRGLKFSRFSRINDEPRKFYPPKFYLRLTYVAREYNPRKLNREKFGQGSSAKILVLENF